MTTIPAPQVRHVHVLPWEQMTVAQQAEHLVHGHGFNADYWYDGEHGERSHLDTDAEVAAWYANHWDTEARDLEHAEDHNSQTPGGGAIHCRHDHTKETDRA